MLCVAYDPTRKVGKSGAGACVLGVQRKRHLVETWARKEFCSEVLVPHAWCTWDSLCFPGGPKEAYALSIDDPRLVGYVMSCDRMRRAGSLDEEYRLSERKEEWEAEAKARERQARAKELWEPFKRMVDDQCGFVGREGGGGERKFFYDGCLQEG